MRRILRGWHYYEFAVAIFGEHDFFGTERTLRSLSPTLQNQYAKTTIPRPVSPRQLSDNSACPKGPEILGND